MADNPSSVFFKENVVYTEGSGATRKRAYSLGGDQQAVNVPSKLRKAPRRSILKPSTAFDNNTFDFSNLASQYGGRRDSMRRTNSSSLLMFKNENHTIDFGVRYESEDSDEEEEDNATVALAKPRVSFAPNAHVRTFSPGKPTAEARAIIRRKSQEFRGGFAPPSSSDLPTSDGSEMSLATDDVTGAFASLVETAGPDEDEVSMQVESDASREDSPLVDDDATADMSIVSASNITSAFRNGWDDEGEEDMAEEEWEAPGQLQQQLQRQMQQQMQQQVQAQSTESLEQGMHAILEEPEDADLGGESTARAHPRFSEVVRQEDAEDAEIMRALQEAGDDEDYGVYGLDYGLGTPAKTAKTGNESDTASEDSRKDLSSPRARYSVGTRTPQSEQSFYEDDDMNGGETMEFTTAIGGAIVQNEVASETDEGVREDAEQQHPATPPRSPLHSPTGLVQSRAQSPSHPASPNAAPQEDRVDYANMTRASFVSPKRKSYSAEDQSTSRVRSRQATPGRSVRRPVGPSPLKNVSRAASEPSSSPAAPVPSAPLLHIPSEGLGSAVRSNPFTPSRSTRSETPLSLAAGAASAGVGLSPNTRGVVSPFARMSLTSTITTPRRFVPNYDKPGQGSPQRVLRTPAASSVRMSPGRVLRPVSVQPESTTQSAQPSASMSVPAQSQPRQLSPVPPLAKNSPSPAKHVYPAKQESPSKQESPAKHAFPVTEAPPPRSGAMHAESYLDLSLTDDLSIEAPEPILSLDEFFAKTDAGFMTDILEVTGVELGKGQQRRKSVMPSARVPATFADTVAAAAHDSLFYQLYQSDQSRLREEIRSALDALAQVDDVIQHKQPRIFVEWQTADAERRVALQNQFRQIKSHYYLTSRIEWNECRDMNHGAIMAVMEEHLAGLEADARVLDEVAELDAVLPELEARYAALSAELETERSRDAELSSCDPDELHDQHMQYVEQSNELEKLQRKFAEVQSQLPALTAKIGQLDEQEAAMRNEKDLLVKRLEENRFFTKEEVSRLRVNYAALESLQGWRLKTHTATSAELTHRGRFDVRLEMADGIVRVVTFLFERDAPGLRGDLIRFLFTKLVDHIKAVVNGAEVAPERKTPQAILLRISHLWSAIRRFVHEFTLINLELPTRIHHYSANLLRIKTEVWVPEGALFDVIAEITGEELFNDQGEPAELQEAITKVGLTVKSKSPNVDCTSLIYALRETVDNGGSDGVYSQACLETIKSCRKLLAGV